MGNEYQLFGLQRGGDDFFAKVGQVVAVRVALFLDESLEGADALTRVTLGRRSSLTGAWVRLGFADHRCCTHLGRELA